MVSNSLRKKQLYRRAGLSFLIIGIISVSYLGIFARMWWIGPRCTTCFFHFNIDYRLGKPEVEDTIIREPYYKLMLLYEKHPNWKFTVECQAEMMYKVYTNPEYAEIANLTTKLVNSGQMELICGLQFSQLFYAYPADVIELNLKHAKETLEDYGLLDKRSRCLLFQEGQYGYGLATALNSPYAENIDTVMVSTQQLVDFRRPDYRGGNYPVYQLENTETNKKIYLLQYDYLPQWEAGYTHAWNFLLDAELGFEDGDADKEFAVSDEKLSAWEQQLQMLELQGNQFMTCSEWVSHCINVGAVGELDYYIPECNWGTTKYNSSYIWAANNGDSTDDGEMLANNYRCRQVILATREVYEEYKSDPGLSSKDKSSIEAKFHAAEKLWLQATVTDSTGIGPDAIERVTAEGNVYKAQLNCSQILTILAKKVAGVPTSRMQVDLQTGEIHVDSANFISLTRLQQSNLDLEDLPLDVNYDSSVNGKEDLVPEILVSKVQFDSNDDENVNLDAYQLDITFEGTHDWADDSIQSISITFTFPDYEQSMKEIVYSPSLLEDYTKRAYRYNYGYHPLYIFLPLSNGMIFLPDTPHGNRGTALVKSVTTRHTSWLWNYWSLTILETEGLHLDAHHKVYLLEDVTLDEAHSFANRINVNPPWMIGQNPDDIQGHEVYDVYSQMENKFAEDQGSGEWW